jgi:predicted transcriptional regulator YdeE
MSTVDIAPFRIIGIAMRTTNENGQSMRDIPALWEKFLTENIMANIPGKADQAIYCVYTDYEKDHTRPYTTIIGCKVDPETSAPAGTTAKEITGGKYEQRAAHGKLMEGAVYQEWVKIWNSDIPRTYTADFEVYGEKAQDPGNATVDIFLAV